LSNIFIQLVFDQSQKTYLKALFSGIGETFIFFIFPQKAFVFPLAVTLKFH